MEIRRFSETALLITLFFLFIISTLAASDIWSNLASPLVGFAATLVLFRSVKAHGLPRFPWVYLLAFTAVWTFADCCWLVMEHLLGIDPSRVYWLEVLYTLPSLFLMSFSIRYFREHLQKWNGYQLLLDLLTVVSLILIFMWAVIFLRTNLRFNEIDDYILTMVYLFAGFFSLTSMLLIYISNRDGRIHPSFYYLFLGIAISSGNDFYYAYLTLADLYQANTLVDVLYLLPLILFSKASIHARTTFAPTGADDLLVLPQNYGRKKSARLLPFLLLLLLLTKTFSIEAFLAATFIIILHQLLTSYVQTSIRNEYLLKKELYLNEQLEQQVVARSQDLIVANETLSSLAKKDSLTGLFNRRYFIDRLDARLNQMGATSFGVLYLDLNRFKSINDTHGHELGDHVLVEISQRIAAACSPSNSFFRIGGDEFAILTAPGLSKEGIDLLSQQVIEAINFPVELPPYIFHLGVSIGVSLYPDDATTRDLLMKYADMAMYEAKDSHQNSASVRFNSTLREKIERKHSLEIMLGNADFSREFQLYFQPQFRISDHALVGMEALLRWFHPHQGMISPGEFIPVAEETGIILPITEWVIDQAYATIAHARKASSLSIQMGINLSPKVIETADLLASLKQKEMRHCVPPHWIDLEITENSAMSLHATIEGTFDQLKQSGFTISIDDFGTGYSSLSYIRRFGVDRLKIAKELVDHVADDRNSQLIIKAIIMMAKGMNLRTIAEGVEYQDQLDVLKEMGCDEMQGYLWGRPVPFETFKQQYLS
ncbi:putative bifunctional diguanylate cyclase/phosphodiesterase [Anoxynatronum buryatiense]|uniref:Diguanylate cyclase/phosphodiesterase n=1 Tax=Anoxynatronum buryatiense TaxID=489973 RepID=A0AA45WWP2_9CLOT|nr:GGDEF domain-containing phosphodiesterase [Anoxynatronum buryatiense]SMP60539.1 diguanylate cyclase/phosphodiesterase [Anoxynatronum buryatiense]